MRIRLAAALLIMGAFMDTSPAMAQNWSLGVNMGMSVVDGSAGFQMTPVAEFLFNHRMAIGSEFSVNTQYSSPLFWYPYFKFYFSIAGSRVRPYANAGPVMTLRIQNAPRFGVLFGGGVNIPVAGNLYLTPDVQVGTLFNVGGGTYGFAWFENFYGDPVYNGIFNTIPGVNVFVWTVRGGLRYEL